MTSTGDTTDRTAQPCDHVLTVETSPCPPERAAAPDPYDEAIQLLTRIARRTVDCGDGTTRPVDFADGLAQILAAVAANIGHVERLLAGRSGSWEADLVRELINGTAPEDELVRWRTEPVQIYLDIDDALSRLGIFDLYDEACQEVYRARDELDDALLEAGMTPEQRARRAALLSQNEAVDPALLHQDPKLHEEHRARIHELCAIWAAASERGLDARPDLAKSLQAATSRIDALEAMYDQDKAAYSASYRQVIHDQLRTRSLRLEVEFTRVFDAARWEPLADDLERHAEQHTPLPMTGAPPSDAGGTASDALRCSGLTYLDRLDEAD